MAEPYGNYHATDGRASGDYGGEHLVVRSVPVPDPGDLIGWLPEPAAFAWVRHGAGLTGWGEAARVTLPSGPDRFAVGEKWLHDLGEPRQHFGPHTGLEHVTQKVVELRSAAARLDGGPRSDRSATVGVTGRAFLQFAFDHAPGQLRLHTEIGFYGIVPAGRFAPGQQRICA